MLMGLLAPGRTNHRIGRRIAARAMLAHGNAMDGVIDGFGNIGRMVPDTFEVFGDEQQMGAAADIAGVFHHIRHQFTEQRVIDIIDRLIRAPDLHGLLGVVFADGIDDGSDEGNDDGSEDMIEPEAGEIEKAEPVNTSNVSDADMEASYKYTELERRLAAAKSNILKLRKGKSVAGDINDKPSTELQRLRDLKASLEQRIANLKANSAYVRKISNTPEPEDLEMPEEEEPLQEDNSWELNRLQYYAGIKK